MVANPVSVRITQETKHIIFPDSDISYNLEIMCVKMCLVPEGGSDPVPPAPPTKSFGYRIGYFYGSGIQVEQWHGYEIDFENVEDMVAYVINDIESTYENHKDSSKDGYPLEIVVLYIMNKKAITENDDPPDSAMCEITLYGINKEMSELIDGVDIEDHCDLVFFADEEVLSSDDE